MRALVPWWQSRTPRERVIVLAAALFMAIVAYGLFVSSADQARTRLRARVAALRMQAVQVEREASEIEALKSESAKIAAPADLRAVVQEQASAAGIAGTLGRVEAPSEGELQVSFGAVGFAQWLGWISNLESRHVLLESCRIEALSSPGLVSLTATLSRPR